MQTFIVTFKPDTTDAEIQRAKDGIIAKGGSIEHEYTLIRGFSAKIPNGPAIQALESSPHVENIEADQVVTTQ